MLRACPTRWLVALAFAGTLAASMAEAQPIPAEIPLATDAPLPAASAQQHVRIGTQTIAYRASWFESVLKSADGVALATISATSYVRDGVSDPALRPVVFLFNGGPGASSSPLHFSAVGPRRLGERDASGARPLVENEESLLDSADLVFVDPVGTGFSRPLRPGGGKPYWTPQGDAASVLGLIRDWLRANGRLGSPLYVAGESYGGYRLATMAKDMGDLHVAGLILLSPALDMDMGEDQAAVDALPTMAVAACEHRKVRCSGRNVAAVWEAARRFAQQDYVVALQQGSALPAAQKRRIAQRIASLVGLPADVVATADLRVDTQKFLEALVPGQVVGRLDVRVTAPIPAKAANPSRPAAANDPSLGLGRTNVILSKPIGDYLRDTLKVATARDYYSLSLDVNFSWDWRGETAGPGGTPSPASNFTTLMRQRPAMRILLLGGYYDLAVPILAPRYTLAHSGVPLDRVRMVALEAGHSPFDGDSTRGQASQLVHDFVK